VKRGCDLLTLDDAQASRQKRETTLQKTDLSERIFRKMKQKM
jgi:hypothetical protein